MRATSLRSPKTVTRGHSAMSCSPTTRNSRRLVSGLISVSVASRSPCRHKACFEQAALHVQGGLQLARLKSTRNRSHNRRCLPWCVPGYCKSHFPGDCGLGQALAGPAVALH